MGGTVKSSSWGKKKTSADEPSTEVWVLEDSFPDIGELLSPSQLVSAAIRRL